MYISNINNSPACKAKFIDNKDLRNVVEYSIENDCFDKLNKARKRIGIAYLTRRLKLELGEPIDGYPVVAFTRYTPNRGIIPTKLADYTVSKPIVYTSNKKMNPFEYAIEMIIKLSNNAPKNKMYQKVVVGINKSIK